MFHSFDVKRVEQLNIQSADLSKQNEVTVSLPDIKIKREARIVSQFKKYRRVLSVFGLFIVFITFVVKDAYREQLSELRARVSSEYNLFTIELEFKKLAEDIDQDNTPPDRQDNCLEVAREKNSLELMLNGIAYFVDAFPDKERWKPRLDELYSKYNHANDIWMAFGSHQRPGQSVDCIGVLGLYFEVREKANFLSGDLSQDADETLERTEKRYRLMTWISYVLYTVGWGLTLLDRMVVTEEAAIELET